MKRFTMALVLGILAASFAFAQSSTGRLTGTVSTADGVLPGATVVLTDTKTGKARTTVSNNEGSYSFALLDYGEYSLKVSAAGFKNAVTTLTVQSAQEYSLAVTMTIGDVSENVTVTAGADIINSTNAELSSTVGNRQITELPLAARNPLSLILTQAGTGSNPSQNTSINGGRTSSTNITRDGVNINDNFIRSNATDFSSSRVSVDNVEEFTLSSQSSVDSGFGSAQVAFVTPRGSNQFHGAGWEYNRNSHMASNSWFSNAGGNYSPTDPLVLAGLKVAGGEKSPRPFRNRNQYGVKVAGPIWKNKIFFFAYAERLKDIVYSNKLTTVLTPSARAGQFKYISGANTYTTNIFCPGCFTNGTSGIAVPTAINSAITSNFLSGMPAGNSTETGDGLNTTGYRFSQQANTDRDALTGRVDYDVNSKNNVNAVIDYNLERNLRSDLGGTSVTPLVLQPARNVTYSGGWRWSPTATLSNEFRAGQLYSAPEFFRTDTATSEYFLTPLITNPGPLNGTAIFRPQGRFVKTRNLQDTVSWLHGNHSFRFGAQYQSVQITAYNDAGTLPVYTIGLSTSGPVLSAATLATAAAGPALTTAQQTTARNLFALLGGVISAGQQTYNTSSQTSGFVSGYTALSPYKFWMLAPYILDQWKLTPNLTLNLGIRYDYQAPLILENGLRWEPTIASGVDPRKAILDPAGTFQFIGGNAGKPNAFYRADNNNWAPTIGLAWSPKGIENRFLKAVTGENFVIRGGYRKSYVNDELVTAPNNALANHPGFSSTIAALTNGGTSTLLDDRVGAAHTSVLTTPAFVNTRNYTTNNTASFSNTGTVFGVDPNLKTPEQNDYNVGVQRQFGAWVAEARYVGGFSKNMLRTVDYNQIVIPNAYKSDFNTLRANVLAGCPAANGGAAGSAQACANGTTLINTMVSFGSVTPTNANGSLVLTGQIAELAWQQIVAGNMPNANTTPYPAGTLRAQFLPNPNAGVVNLLENGGTYYYNSGQFELRRKFSQGLYLQANYTFSKELTDAIGTGQTRVEPFLDNNNRGLDYARADYDQTHVININALYELPFGRNHRWLNENKWLDYLVGGWQVGGVLRIASGAPITFLDPTGTLNRTGRAARQTALTNLTDGQLKNLVGRFITPCGVYFINPQVLNINQSNLAAGNCGSLTTGLPTGTTGGAGASGFGQATFQNQVFFNNGPNSTSGMRRAIVNGPWYSSADMSLLKNFRIKEGVTFQIRAEAYNFLNTPYFAPGQLLNVNSTSFGKITSVAVGSRVMQFAGRLNF
ncbi:hypothetical protein BH10ACI3_BH10ACI3_21270 [soil metagenome]